MEKNKDIINDIRIMKMSIFLQRNDNMALDYDNRIMQEYQDNISGKDTFFQMFFVEMHRQKRFIYGDSKINKREKADSYNWDFMNQKIIFL